MEMGLDNIPKPCGLGTDRPYGQGEFVWNVDNTHQGFAGLPPAFKPCAGKELGHTTLHIVVGMGEFCSWGEHD